MDWWLFGASAAGAWVGYDLAERLRARMNLPGLVAQALTVAMVVAVGWGAREAYGLLRPAVEAELEGARPTP